MGFALKKVNKRNNSRGGDWIEIRYLLKNFLNFKFGFMRYGSSLDQTFQIIPDLGNNHTLKAVLRIRITLMRIRIMLLILMRIRILLATFDADLDPAFHF
jgi:hypothetical protein